MRIISMIFLLSTVPLFSCDNFIIQEEIIDPMGIFNNFNYEKFLDEREYSVKEEEEYLSYQNGVLSKLEVVSGLDTILQVLGEWNPENYIPIERSNFLSYIMEGMKVDQINNIPWVEFNVSSASNKLYRYGNYFITNISLFGGIGPLILINIIDGRCYFYILEGSTWKLLPYHKGGEVYLKKVLPNS